LRIPILGRKSKDKVSKKVEPYALRQEGPMGSGIGAEGLERGVGGRMTSIIPPSMAETRSIATTETGDGSAGNNRVPSPNTVARKDVRGYGNGSNMESSERSRAVKGLP
jgi:hypothetical protein